MTGKWFWCEGSLLEKKGSLNALVLKCADDDTFHPSAAHADLIVNAVHVPELVKALEDIAEGAGPFNRDPLTHAENCIDAMKECARDALALARGERV